MKGSRGSREEMRKETLESADAQGEKLKEAFGDITKKMLTQGMSPKEAMGINDGLLESIYAQAYRLYNTGKYIEATHLFRLLVMMNSLESKYILGLGACFHMLKEYDNAIQTYTMCSVIDPESPIPYYHSSDCFIQMKDYLSAMVCLEMTISHAGDKPEYTKIKERAQMSLESLKTQLDSSPSSLDETSK